MSNFSHDDRIRSIRRFLAAALGSPPWRVRTERQQIKDEERPVALVEATGPAGQGRLPARMSIPQGNVDRMQSFTVTLYPALADTAGEARLEAFVVAELLEQSILLGLVNSSGPDFSFPQRLPVFDFKGVPVKGQGAARAGSAEPYGWFFVEDFPVRAIPDPDDPLRWTVVCELRLSWEQGGRIVKPAPRVSRLFGQRTQHRDDPVVVPILPGGADSVLVLDGAPDDEDAVLVLDAETGDLYRNATEPAQLLIAARPPVSTDRPGYALDIVTGDLYFGTSH